MRFLADSTFPASIQQPNAEGIEILRYSGPSIEDRDLLAFAAAQGCVAVLMLGREVLAEPQFEELVSQAGVTVVVTVSENPLEAAEQLLPRLDEVVKRLGILPVVVMGKAGAIDQVSVVLP